MAALSVEPRIQSYMTSRDTSKSQIFPSTAFSMLLCYSVIDRADHPDNISSCLAAF